MSRAIRNEIGPGNKPPREANIYTDGACSRNGQGDGAKAGIGVYWPDNPSNNISMPIGGRQTNQRAEIEAARTGIQQAKDQGFTKVTVNTDSHYVKKAAESWIPNWEKEGWTRPVVNRDEFRELRDTMRDIDVKFEYVASKDNHADPLARAGAMKETVIFNH